MFGELAAREEEYKAQNGTYLAAAACPSTTRPSGTSPSSCLATAQPWALLNVRVPYTTLICSYTITVGTSASTTTAPTGFSFTVPPESWYFITATCDTDGRPTLNTQYFTASNDSSTQKLNAGN